MEIGRQPLDRVLLAPHRARQIRSGFGFHLAREMGETVLQHDQFAGQIDQGIDARFRNANPAARRIILRGRGGVAGRLRAAAMSLEARSSAAINVSAERLSCAIAPASRDRRRELIKPRMAQRIRGAPRRRADASGQARRAGRRRAASRIAPR